MEIKQPLRLSWWEVSIKKRKRWQTKIFVQLDKPTDKWVRFEKPPILCLSIVYILFRGQYREILKHEKALLQVPHA